MPLQLPHVDIMLGNDWMHQHNVSLRLKKCTLSSAAHATPSMCHSTLLQAQTLQQ
jgi:hypothetical protein